MTSVDFLVFIFSDLCFLISLFIATLRCYKKIQIEKKRIEIWLLKLLFEFAVQCWYFLDSFDSFRSNIKKRPQNSSLRRCAF